MVTIRWKIYALNEATSLCVTCTWGLVRMGFRASEAETFCRLIAPNGMVPFPVRECSGYTDRRAPDPASGRRIGFVSTELVGESEEIEIIRASSSSASAGE